MEPYLGRYANRCSRDRQELRGEWLSRVTVLEGRCVRHRFWQPGGGYDRNITSSEALRAMIDTIHANPVRRGLVARVEDWMV